MISRLEGELVAVTAGRAHVKHDAITYELLIPASDEQRLYTQLGETVRFHTLHYFDSQNQGASFVPRLIGFATASDRAFFELFTTVKGIGNRKALRALALPFDSIANAIAMKDVDLLKSLPEIGKRTAETIIAELHGKLPPPGPPSFGAGGSGSASGAVGSLEVKSGGERSGGATSAQYEIIRDAAVVLTRLGESRVQAHQLVERALAQEPSIDTADALVAAALSLRQM